MLFFNMQKDKMKKNFLRLFSMIIILFFSIVLVSCKKPKDDYYEVKKYVVSFETNGGSPITDFLVDEGTKISKPEDPKKDGFTFISWYKNSELTLEWIFDEHTVNSSVTLYAKWKDNKPEEIKYTVKFESNGGTKTNDVVILQNSKLGKPVDPKKANYKFLGWYKEKEFLESWNFELDLVSSNITLYAKWEENEVINEYTVTFESNGGSFIDNIIVNKSDFINKPIDPTLNDHIFLGWYQNSDLTKLWNFDTDKVTKNTKLYAKWELIETEYLVKFNSNEGSVVSSLNVKENNLIQKPDNPQKTKYFFLGWYKDESLLILWDFEKDLVNSDITLYAKWERDLSDEWQLINNSNIKEVLLNNNLNVFNEGTYKFDVKNFDLYNTYSIFSSSGVIDLNQDFESRVSFFDLELKQDEYFHRVYQDGSNHYIISYNKITNKIEEKQKINSNGIDYFFASLFLSYDDFNNFFSSVLLNMLSEENGLNDSTINLYKKGNSHKLDINFNETSGDQELLRYILMSSGSKIIENSFGDFSLSIVFENNEINNFKFNLDVVYEKTELSIDIDISKTTEKVTLPEDLEGDFDYIEEVTTFDVIFEDKTSIKLSNNYSHIEESDLSYMTFVDGYKSVGYFYDDKFTEPIKFPSRVNIDKIYVKREKTLTTNDYFNEIVDADSYTLEVHGNNSNILITEQYHTYQNYLYDVINNRVLLNLNDEIFELSTNLSNPLIKINIKESLKKQPIKYQHFIILISKDNIILMYDPITRQFELNYKQTYNDELSMDRISFKIVDINNTEISDNILKAFTKDEYNKEEPISLNFFSEDMIYHDLDESDLPIVKGEIEFNNHTVYIEKVKDLEKYNITCEKYSSNEYDTDLPYIDNLIIYKFFFEDMFMGELVVTTYKSSRGSILVNPKYYNYGYEMQNPEPLYYYVNELNELPNFNFEEDIYKYSYEFRGKSITNITDVKNFNNKVINLVQVKSFINIDMFYEHLISNKIEYFNRIDSSFYYIDFLNEEITSSRYSAFKIIHINDKPYFSYKGIYNLIYLEMNEENLEKYSFDNLTSIKKAYQVYSILKERKNYSLINNNIHIDGIGSIKNKLDETMNNEDFISIDFLGLSELNKGDIYTVEVKDLFTVYGYSSNSYENNMGNTLDNIEISFDEFDFYYDEKLEIKLNHYDNNYTYAKRDYIKIYYKLNEAYLINPDEVIEILNSYDSYTMKSSNSMYKVNEKYIEFVHTNEMLETKKYVLDRATNKVYLILDDLIILDPTAYIFDIEFLINHYDHKSLYFQKNYYNGSCWNYRYHMGDLTIELYFMENRRIGINITGEKTQTINNTETFDIIDINETVINEYDFKESISDEILKIDLRYPPLFTYDDFLHRYSLVITYKYKEEVIIYSYNISSMMNYKIINNGKYIDYSIEIDGKYYHIKEHELKFEVPIKVDFYEEIKYADKNKDLNELDFSGHVYFENQELTYFRDLNYLYELGISVEITPEENNENLYILKLVYDNEIIGSIYLVYYDSFKGKIVINRNFNLDNTQVKAYYYVSDLSDLSDLNELIYNDGKIKSILYYGNKLIENVNDLFKIEEDIIILDEQYSYIDNSSFYLDMKGKLINVRSTSGNFGLYEIDLINQTIRNNYNLVIKYIDGKIYVRVEDSWNYHRYIMFDDIIEYENQELYQQYVDMNNMYQIFSDKNNFKIEGTNLTINKLGNFGNLFYNTDIRSISGEDYYINYYQEIILREEERYDIEVDELFSTFYMVDKSYDINKYIFDNFLNDYSYIRFFIDQNDFDNNWINKLLEDKKIILKFEYNEQYNDNYEDYLNEILSFENYTLENGSINYLVSKDSIIVKYYILSLVINREKQTIHTFIDNEVLINEHFNYFYNLEDLVFDLEYVLNNYISVDKSFYNKKWNYKYELKDHCYIISFDNSRELNVQKIDKNSQNILQSNKFMIRNINNTDTVNFDFNNIQKDNIVDFTLRYDDYLTYEEIIDNFSVAFVFKSKYVSSLYSDNVKTLYNYEFILSEDKKSFKFRLIFDDYILEEDNYTFIPEEEFNLIFFTNDKDGKYILVPLDEFNEIDSIMELNERIIDNIILRADFKEFFVDGHGSFYNLYQLKNYLFEYIISQNQKRIFIEIRYKGYSSFSNLLEDIESGYLVFNMDGTEIVKIYNEISFVDENGKKNTIIFPEDEMIYRIDYIDVDISMIDEKIKSIIDFILEIKNGLEPIKYQDETLFYYENISIKRSSYTFLLTINDLELDIYF